MRYAGFFPLAMLTACATTPALRAGEQWFRAPNFCVALAANEKIEREDPGSDFFLYHYQGGGKSAVIYEGNHPQRGGVVFQTGQPFPSVLSVHGDAAFARRLLVGARMSACR